MCSFGARLLLGEASSSVCGTTMMDSMTNTSMGVQSVGTSLATALRDRQAYVIPMQPNRSLPVRPAPHHTPCRATIVRSSLSRPSPFVITTLQPLVIDAPRTCENAPEPVKTTAKSPHEAQRKEEEKKKEVIIEEKQQEAQEETEEEAISQRKVKRASVEEGRSPLKEEIPIKKEAGLEGRSSEMRRKFNRETSVFASEGCLIDISHSPERVELDVTRESSPTTERSSRESSSPARWSREPGVREKRKRRRSGSKRASDEVREIFVSGPDETGCRTVPPLRLKKIQSLRGSVGSGWREEIGESGLSSGNALAKRLKITDSFSDRDEEEAIKQFSGNYRIVTGHTPPYDELGDASSTTGTKLDGLDAAKLRYRQSKLKLKLHELRRKAVDFGKEMLRTVLTSARTPRGSRLRQTIDRCEQQIDDLERLLNMLPKASDYAEDKEEVKWRNDADTTSISTETKETRQSVVVSPSRTRSSSTSSSLCSSPSLGPPKLSPRSPTNWDAARSPSDVRNSPPVLPRVYVTIADCREYSWEGRGGCSKNRHGRRRNRSGGRREAAIESTTIGTTSKMAAERKIEIVDEPVDSDSTTKIVNEVAKIDFDRSSCNSVDVLEEYENETREEKKYRVEKIEDTKMSVKSSASPAIGDIDTTSVDDDFEGKPSFGNVIGDLAVDDVMRIESPPISSTCEIARDCETKTNETQCNEFANVRDEPAVVVQQTGNGLTIDEQFPTLGNWIAGLSRKQVGVDEANDKLNETTNGTDRTGALQQVFNAETDKPMEPGVLQNSAPTIVHENVVTPQWRRNEIWQEQQDQQQPLNQPYAPTVPLPPPPPPPQLGQEFCSPIAMARLYTRNYSIDPYGVTYGYNPAIAAAAATASLWNSAAILQYPLMRPNSAMINAQSSPIQPPPVQSSNVQFPTGSIAQRPVFRGVQQQIAASKRPGVDGPIANYGQRDGIPSSYACAKRTNPEFQQALAAAQGRLPCNNVNGQQINYRSCLQQPQQPQDQRQFASAPYADSSMRLPVPTATWRTGPAINTMATGYNYTGNPGWPAPPGNPLNALSRTSTSGLAPPSAVPPVNASRTRSSKGPIDTNFRNCETPHLGKVAYSPNTVGSLRCSNCGLPGSMFKCLGCSVAFYCDENCQARHWNRHVISCPKKMPKLKKLVN